jgi:hypothetical protein
MITLSELYGMKIIISLQQMTYYENNIRRPDEKIGGGHHSK